LALVVAGAFAPGFLALAALITVTGLLTGPRDTLQSTLLADRTPARYRTEVFSWLNTFMWIGYGLGTATAGNLTGPGDSAAAAVALMGAVLSAVAYRPTPRAAAMTRASRPQTPPARTV
jgi:MFS family permease